MKMNIVRSSLYFQGLLIILSLKKLPFAKLRNEHFPILHRIIQNTCKLERFVITLNRYYNIFALQKDYIQNIYGTAQNNRHLYSAVLTELSFDIQNYNKI